MIQELVLYNPHDLQLKAHRSKARNRVLNFGRQAGKSTWGSNEIADKAWTNPRKVFWVFEPSFDQATVQFRRFIEEFPRDCGIYRKKPNETERRLFLNNYSDIQYKSGAVLHRVRGETLGGVIIDEVRDQPPELIAQVLPPMLAINKAWVAYLSTPKGFDLFYDLSQKAQSDTSGEWDYFHAPSTCNPLFSKEEFDRLKREMSESEFAQEILAEFRELSRGSAYGAFSQSNLRDVSPHVKSQVTNALSCPTHEALELHINPWLPIYLYCDWNVTYMGWTLNQFRHGIGHYTFDEICLERSHTQQAAELLIHKLRSYEAELGKLKSDPQIILVGDATGNSQKTSASGHTDFMILIEALKAAGYTVRNLTPDANPLVKDRVNTVNSRLRSADGTIQAWINPKRCPKLKRDLERVTWKEGAAGAILDQVSDRSLTHLSDGYGYGLCVTNPIDKVKDVGRLKVVNR